ncbi:MAG: glycerophosphodiester phosphodiesterase [Tagaea sp.]|nr:glycerophosphodiester phosphodiesterase [Tagaea sp.]
MLRVVAALLALACPAAAFDLQGHRGARGLAPENTLPAFARAIAIGVATLELDTGVSADGAIVVAHDRRLNPDFTRDASGQWIAAPGPRLRDLTLAELKRLDVGALKPGTDYARNFASQAPIPGTRMPTLAEVASLPGAERLRFNVETKISPLAPDETLAPEAFARALIAEIRSLGIAERTTIQSFDWRTLAIAAREAPEIARAYLTFERGANETVFKGKGVSPWTGLDAAAHGNSTPRLVAAAGGKIWSPFFRDLDAPLVAEAKRLGLTVIPWTVNETADMDRVLGLGVDGLITDYPDRAKALLDAKGIRVR